MVLEYKKIKDTYYIRLEKGEKIVKSLKDICKKERIHAGYFQGIGACDAAVTSTYLPERHEFTDHEIKGMLEMISLMGNITTDNNGEPFEHSHVIFSYLDDNGKISVTAGHLKEARILYTGEITLVPSDEKIGRKFDPAAGIDVWDLS